MNAMIVALAASAIVGQIQHAGARYADDQLLATPVLNAPNRADDVHRPGFNGRIWRGPVILGPSPRHHPVVEGSPGPLAYGAGPRPHGTVYAHVGHMVISLDPWTRLPDSGFEDLERARNTWLRQRGYVGGVRTFVNDRYAGPRHETRADRSMPKPRATIRIAPEMPVRHGTLRVDAGG